MAGLVPAISLRKAQQCHVNRDRRDKPGDDNDMTAHIIDGKAIAAELRAKIAGEVARLQAAHGLAPGIAVVLVGDNPASEVYVRNKSRAVA